MLLMQLKNAYNLPVTVMMPSKYFPKRSHKPTLRHVLYCVAYLVLVHLIFFVTFLYPFIVKGKEYTVDRNSTVSLKWFFTIETCDTSRL